MAINIINITSFVRFFEGNRNAYGVHIYGTFAEGKKEEGGHTFVNVEPVHDKLYVDHLEGKKGLGIVPIKKNGTCLFSVIDVDIYSVSLSWILDIIYKYGFPLHPFRSKSGGLHLYTFYSNPVPAKKVISYARLFCTLLGLSDKTEIFPKQERLLTGSIGSSINLPYYNADNSRQSLLDAQGQIISLDEAMIKISESTQTETRLNKFLVDLPLADAPPCLQSLYLKGVTNNRNVYLFSLARYLKTKYGDEFEFKLVDMNNKLTNPLSIEELTKTIVSTHKKRDYSYSCTKEPLLPLCNKRQCKTREYGIGGNVVSELSFEEFVQWRTDPPYYKWTINGTDLTFYAESTICNQQKFRELCFRQLHILPLRLKEPEWTTIINRALKNIVVKSVDPAEDMSPGGRFLYYLFEFLEHRTQAENKEQLLVDRVYKDEKKGVYLIKSRNLISFLYQQRQFKEFLTTEIQERLRKMGGKPGITYINPELSTRVWIIPFSAISGIKEQIKLAAVKVNFLAKDDKKEEF